MDRLIYTAYSGMTASLVRERVIASNMANTQTTGFRADMLNGVPMTLKGPALEARAMTQDFVHASNMKQGTVVPTGNPLDVALTGTALLAVQAPDGSEAYTRRGDLSVTPDGLLLNGDGRPVIGDGGPVTVPVEGKITISPDGSVMASDPQNPTAIPQVIARIKLVSTEGSQVGKGLDGLFRVTGANGTIGALPQDEEAKLVPGSLEQSNVDPTQVLVEMVEAQRLFDMRTKLIATAREVDEQSTSLMRLPS